MRAHAKLILAAFILALAAGTSARAQENPPAPEAIAPALESVQEPSVDETIQESVAPGNGTEVQAAEGPEEAAHGEPGAEGHEKKAGLPQFDPSSYLGQVFWLAIAFAILYMVFSRKTLPDISSVLEGRQMHIQSDLDTAESLRREAETVHAAYEGALNKARAEASEAFMSAERAIKDGSAQAMRGFHERAAKEIAATENRIAQAKTSAMGEMNAIAADIARQVAEKIVGEKTGIDEAKAVVESLQKRKAA